MAVVTFLSNAGVILDLGGSTLMVDGLYSAEGLPFSDVPEGLLDALPADVLAFTHTHHDHLDQRKLAAYLENHPVKGLLLPPRVRADLHGAPAWVMRGTEGTAEFPGLVIRWYRTPHLDHARPEHHSFVVKGGGITVLVAGDAMPSREHFVRMAAGERIDAMLATPIFLQDPEGRTLVKEVIRPQRLMLYHIPGPEDDVHGLSRMAERQVERWGDEFHATALTKPGETTALL
ncbi:MAG: MBL fold metallo-hydrolase [Clostridia bacterium]|nr:MBL fold metallo-hydrolase [Clostridia bacterium]